MKLDFNYMYIDIPSTTQCNKNCQKIGLQGWLQNYPKSVILGNVTTERDRAIICQKQSNFNFKFYSLVFVLLLNR